MSAFEWYDYGPNLGEKLLAAGLPEDLLEWDTVDVEESGGKHDCTDSNAFYMDPEDPDTGYWVHTSCSYNNGLQSVYMDTGKLRRKMVEVTKMEPAYEPI